MTIPTGDEWLFEMKFDGYRAQVAISGSEVRVYTRNGHDWTDRFKVILAPLKTLTTGSVLLDGEIVAIDKAGRTNFSMLKIGIGAVAGTDGVRHRPRREARLCRG